MSSKFGKPENEIEQRIYDKAFAEARAEIEARWPACGPPQWDDYARGMAERAVREKRFSAVE